MGVNHERFQMADGFGPADLSSLPGGEQDAESLSVASSPGLSQVLASKGLAGGSGGIQLIRLGAIPPRRSHRSVDLDHPFALL